MFNIALEKMMVENPSFSFTMDWIFRGWRWTVKNFGGGVGKKPFSTMETFEKNQPKNSTSRNESSILSEILVHPHAWDDQGLSDLNKKPLADIPLLSGS